MLSFFRFNFTGISYICFSFSRHYISSRLQLSFQHKIGILYCKAGQSTEEEMYNNETAGPAFEEFLDLLGQRVRLKGFSKYRAQLDNKSKLHIYVLHEFDSPKVWVLHHYVSSHIPFVLDLKSIPAGYLGYSLDFLRWAKESTFLKRLKRSISFPFSFLNYFS